MKDHFLAGFFLLLMIITSSCEPERVIRFGVISDVHQDIMHDAPQRLDAFINEMNSIQADFIIQLGDFCRPYDYNKEFMQIWSGFGGSAYHVLGNHDMDGGFSRDSVVSYYQMPDRYYSIDQNGFHFVVLDGNDVNPDPTRSPGYARFIGADQLAWLQQDLELSNNPIVVFSHQALRGSFALENADEVRMILENFNQDNKGPRVLACINGHNHCDTVITINNIHYIEINSASYEWLGGDYAHESYDPSIHQDYPYIQYTAPYEEGIWALICISSNGEISIEGKETFFVGPDPASLGHPGREDGVRSSSRIRDTVLFF